MVLLSINRVNLSEENSFSYYERIARSKKGYRKELLYGKSIKGMSVDHSNLYQRIKVKYDFYDKNIKKLELLVQDTYEDEEKKPYNIAILQVLLL